jgi:hypothetical protein
MARPLPSSSSLAQVSTCASHAGCAHPGHEALSVTPHSGHTDSSTRTHHRLDTLGGALSLACAIHCVALPFILTSLPLLGLSFLAHSVFELAMIVLALGLATASFCWGVKVHGQWKILLPIAAAAVLFVTGMLHTGETHSATPLAGTSHFFHSLSAPSDGHSGGFWSSETSLHWFLIAVGGLMLAAGHFLNDRLCRSCRSCAHD